MHTHVSNGYAECFFHMKLLYNKLLLYNSKSFQVSPDLCFFISKVGGFSGGGEYKCRGEGTPEAFESVVFLLCATTNISNRHKQLIVLLFTSIK